MKLGNVASLFLIQFLVFAFTFSVFADFAFADLKTTITQSKKTTSTATNGADDYYGADGEFQNSLNFLIESTQSASECQSACTANMSVDKDLSLCSNACQQKFGSQSSNSSSGSACGQEYQNLKSACSAQYSSASSKCDGNKDSGMNQASSAASQLSLAFGQQSSSSIQAACSNAGKVSAAANAALAAFRLSCSNAIKNCSDSCGAVVNYLKANPLCDPQGTETSSAQGNVFTCSQLNAKVNEANQAMMNVAQTLNNASQCAALTSATGVPEICKTNPNLPGCASAALMDCSNPTMASNKVCICTNNPSDPSCTTNIQGSSASSSFSSSDPSSRLANKNTATGAEDVYGTDAIAQGQPGSTDYSSGAVSGKQGSGAGIAGGGDSSGGGGSRGGSGGAGADNGHSVNAGFYGGGGGSGFSGSGGSYGGGRGYAGSGNYGSAAGKNGSPNLRQFLPGGMNDPRLRGVAGASGPDGITGPNSNIWQKVNNRYRTMVPSLLP